MRNKFIFFAIISMTIGMTCYCQNTKQLTNQYLIGIWQEGYDVVGSAYLDSYCFFQNNRFEFWPTPYNGLNIVVTIKGSFKLIKDTIIFMPDTLFEKVNGDIVRDRLTTMSNSWSIDNCDLKNIKVNSKPQSATIKSSNTENKEIILIDGKQFFKVSDNPKYY
jgi:hypothetical protein